MTFAAEVPDTKPFPPETKDVRGIERADLPRKRVSGLSHVHELGFPPRVVRSDVQLEMAVEGGVYMR